MQIHQSSNSPNDGTVIGKAPFEIWKGPPTLVPTRAANDRHFEPRAGILCGSRPPLHSSFQSIQKNPMVHIGWGHIWCGIPAQDQASGFSGRYVHGSASYFYCGRDCIVSRGWRSGSSSTSADARAGAGGRHGCTEAFATEADQGSYQRNAGQLAREQTQAEGLPRRGSEAGSRRRRPLVFPGRLYG